jgi:hypothetical protein
VARVSNYIAASPDLRLDRVHAMNARSIKHALSSKDHTFQRYTSLANAFAGESSGVNKEVVKLITDWLAEQQCR